MKPSARKGLRNALLSLLGLLFLLIAGLSLLLGSQSGSRWLLEQVPISPWHAISYLLHHRHHFGVLPEKISPSFSRAGR